MQIDQFVVANGFGVDGGMFGRVFGLDGFQHALLPERHGISFFQVDGWVGGFGDSVQAAACARLHDEVDGIHTQETHSLAQHLLAFASLAGNGRCVNG